MKRCEKSRAKDKKFAVRTNRRNAANQQIPVMRAAIPRRFYLHAFLGLTRTTSRDARRRTDGELVATNIVAREPRPATRLVPFTTNNLTPGPPS